jgi:hypothetical protein
MDALPISSTLQTPLGFSIPCQKIKGEILSPRASEKVKLYKARHLVEMTVSRHPDMLKGGFGSLGNPKAVHCDPLSLRRLDFAGPVSKGLRRKKSLRNATVPRTADALVRNMPQGYGGKRSS